MTLPILQDGAPVLRQIAETVPKEMIGTPKLKKILAEMSETLRAAENGVAIAAPQIGVPLRIFVVRGYILADKKRRDEGSDDVPDRVFINPTIVRQSKKRVEYEGEGCLSVTGIYGTTRRSMKATVRAQDELGKKFERGGTDLLAVIFQHETDHLNGTLFSDHATDLHPARHEGAE
jgi:peptide deformylase